MSRQKAHLSELSIAQFSAIYINSQKTKPPYCSPKDFCLFSASENKLPQDLCDIIISCKQDNLLPSGAASWLPWEDISVQKGRKIFPKESLRILRTKGIWGIAPKIEGNFIFVPICVNFGNFGRMKLKDPDSNICYLVEISKKEEFLIRDSWWIFLGTE